MVEFVAGGLYDRKIMVFLQSIKYITHRDDGQTLIYFNDGNNPLLVKDTYDSAINKVKSAMEEQNVK